MSYQRCPAVSADGERCRLHITRHKYSLIGMPIHKFWNNTYSSHWSEKPSFKVIFGDVNFIDSWRGWVAPLAGFALLIALIVIGSTIPAVNPSNWNTSDQETEITCQIAGLNQQELIHEYASCVYVVQHDIASWR
jgi:hypothetical protein